MYLLFPWTCGKSTSTGFVRELERQMDILAQQCSLSCVKCCNVSIGQFFFGPIGNFPVETSAPGLPGLTYIRGTLFVFFLSTAISLADCRRGICLKQGRLNSQGVVHPLQEYRLFAKCHCEASTHALLLVFANT